MCAESEQGVCAESGCAWGVHIECEERVSVHREWVCRESVRGVCTESKQGVCTESGCAWRVRTEYAE